MTNKILRGSKIRLYPNKRQAQIFDLWRRRTISLWNLLLELEQAAYSGENRKSKLGWRSIWARVLDESYESNLKTWETGKKIRMGKRRGETVPPRTGPEPERPDVSLIQKISRQVTEIDSDTGEILPAKLFMWEHELQKIMARLKHVPRTHWIDDLPSHAAQAVTKDLIKALQAMLRERKKRASGDGGRDTGFPKFKKSRYAAGSVYFANTQISFDFDAHRIKFPNGCGLITYDKGNLATQFRDAKLMGGRIWRQGEKWFLSCQWEMPAPEALPPTGRTAGVKIAAGILLTTYDDRGQTREYTMPPPNPRLVARHRLAGKKLARALTGQKKKKQKLARRKAWQREKSAMMGHDLPVPGPPRIKRSRSYFEAAARLAKLQAQERDQRDDFLHKLTTDVVRKFDRISIQKMDVADLMKKRTAAKAARRMRKKEERDGGDQTKRRDLKPVRKLMRHVAMARCRQLLEYKMKSLRGEHAYIEGDRLEPEVQTCSHCGTINPQMKDGRRILRCEGLLPSGISCGEKLPRNRNAARNARKRLERK